MQPEKMMRRSIETMLSIGDEGNHRGRHDHTEARYWITSSAVASSVSGTVRFSALAVLRLTVRSNLLGCSTGRSDSLVPLRILPA